MSLTRADVIGYLERLSAAELDEFIAELQQRLHLQPVARRSFVTMGAPPTMGMPLEREERELTLVGFGADKIAVIRAVRELWPLGLMEAKKLVESAPVVLRRELSAGEARDIAAVLRRTGAIVEVS